VSTPHQRLEHREEHVTSSGREHTEEVPAEDELADIVRRLIAATGLSLRPLAARTGISYQTWSAYQKRGNDRVISADALERLLQLPSDAPPSLKERARRLCAEIRRPASPPEASQQPAPVEPTRVARGRRRWLTAGIASVLLAGAVGASAYVMWPLASGRSPGAAAKVTQQPHAPGADRSPSTCQRQYRVRRDGNIDNTAKHPVGVIVAGADEVFVRDDAPGHPAMPYRYYGTVAGQPPGYVLQENLFYIGTTCAPQQRTG
jgi:transcriptional regulator with XRE-family HTH domain